MFRDLRHGLRTLLRDKGWTSVIVLSLAFGIGANAALFGAINSLFLRKLPVKDPDSLVRLKYAGRNDMVTDSSDYGGSAKTRDGLEVRSTFSYPMYRQFLADNRTMDDLFACAPYSRANIVIDGQAEVATAFAASGNYYRMLGLTASPGRTIAPDDDQPAAAPVAVISAKYWRTRFAGDPHVIGKVVRLNNLPLTIVGVITPDLVDVQQAVHDSPDIAVPLALVSQLANAPTGPGEPSAPILERPTYWWLQVMGRRKPGVSAEQVLANLDSVFQHTARAGYESYAAALSSELRASSNYRDRFRVPHLRVESGSRGIYDVNKSDASAVTILSIVVVLVLLIVCANVANLLLSRAASRQREISIRSSLGATRGRLIRQLLTESLLLAAMGGTLAVLVGRWGQQLLPGNAGRPAPLDWRVFAFVFAVAGLTGIIFGIAPALRATRMDVGSALKETSRSVAGSRSILSRSLLVAQVAISLVLLVAAGLFLRTLQNLRNVDVGFNTRNLVLFRLNPALNRYDDARAIALYERLSDRIRSVASVRSVAFSNQQLLSGSVNSTSLFVQGRTYAQDKRDSINRLVVSPGFFETMEMPLRAGRAFTARDDQAAPKVAIVNETAVRKFFPNENPIGRHIGSRIETAGEREIVGVLRDAKYDSVRDPAPPTMYVPHLQNRMGSAVFHVRTAGEPAGAVGAIREAVRQIDPDLPMVNVSTQVDEVEKRLTQERVFAQAYALFGALALLLASVGLFGLMSYSVAQRTNEIGIRMALGAQYRDVLRLVMTESMVLVIVGVGLGLAAALAASRLVTSLLYGLAPTDLTTMLAAMAVLITVSTVAGYLPARRAARVDPLVALHYE
jgi:predicted permease